jgi:hypothetical protein
MIRPTRPSETRSKEAAAKLLEEEPVRIVLEVPPDCRHALKVRALERKLTLRDYLLGLVRADGVTW